jgi:hypothetical protein
MMKKNPQRVVAVERDAPGKAAPGALNRPLPRWSLWLLGLLAVAIALIVLPHLGSLHVYEKHFRGNAPQVRLRFDELSTAMDEPAVKAHFQDQLSLTCIPETQVPLGNRVCYSALRRANGAPALTMALFLRDGRLRHGVLHVPWWAHGAVQANFTRDHGRPQPAGVDETGTPLLRWNLPNGRLEMNKSRYFGPLNHSTVLWTATQ